MNAKKKDFKTENEGNDVYNQIIGNFFQAIDKDEEIPSGFKEKLKDVFKNGEGIKDGFLKIIEEMVALNAEEKENNSTKIGR